jgi:hypothetical protein
MDEDVGWSGAEAYGTVPVYDDRPTARESGGGTATFTSVFQVGPQSSLLAIASCALRARLRVSKSCMPSIGCMVSNMQVSVVPLPLFRLQISNLQPLLHHLYHRVTPSARSQILSNLPMPLHVRTCAPPEPHST